MNTTPEATATGQYNIIHRHPGTHPPRGPADFALGPGEPLPPIATPRTDAVLAPWSDPIDTQSMEDMTDLARALERENAVLRDNLRTLTGLAGGVPPAVVERPLQAGDKVLPKMFGQPFEHGVYTVTRVLPDMVEARNTTTGRHIGALPGSWEYVGGAPAS